MILAFILGKWRWLAGGAALIALAWLHGCSHGKGIVEKQWAAVQAESARQSAKASEQASVAKEVRDVAGARQTEELRHEAAKGDDRPVGPGQRAVLERMREQQRRTPATAR